MRLIDADELERTLEALEQGDNECWVPAEFKEYVIDNAPTVDAVPIIRCKDCKHFKYGKYCNLTNDQEDRRSPNDFCSYGERRGKNERLYKPV